jgi:protease I
MLLSPAGAMGAKPPAKEEPKYKLEILKMEFVNAPTPEAVSPRKILMVIPHRDFQDKELSIPKSLLEKEGHKITIASSSLSEAKGMLGMKIKPDILLKTARAADYDAIIFIGGNGATQYFDDPEALSLAIEARKNDKIIGAICIAPVILAKAGLLENRKAAVSPYGKSELKKAGAVCSGNAVEVDGKIITGSGPAAAADFGKAILKALSSQ